MAFTCKWCIKTDCKNKWQTLPDCLVIGICYQNGCVDQAKYAVKTEMLRAYRFKALI